MSYSTILDREIATDCATAIQTKNAFYDTLEKIYSMYSERDDFLNRNIAVLEITDKVLADLKKELDKVNAFHSDRQEDLTAQQEEVLDLLKEWWKVFIQEATQNQIMSSRFIKKIKGVEPYSVWAQFSDARRGRKFNRRENYLLKKIAKFSAKQFQYIIS